MSFRIGCTTVRFIMGRLHEGCEAGLGGVRFDPVAVPGAVGSEATEVRQFGEPSPDIFPPPVFLEEDDDVIIGGRGTRHFPTGCPGWLDCGGRWLQRGGRRFRCGGSGSQCGCRLHCGCGTCCSRRAGRRRWNSGA